LSTEIAGLQTAASGLLSVLTEAAGGAGRWKGAVRSEIGAGQTEEITQLVVRANLANMRPRRSPPGTS
jgi:hypothetical protein